MLHGEARKGKATAEYKTWTRIRERCLSPGSKDYPSYGGRGIRVCKEWDNFTNFKRDMGVRPPGTTLDRIDNDGHYSHINCRWATRKVQARNRRSTVRLKFNGLAMSIAEWADRNGLNYETLFARISRGWSIDRALSTPATSRRFQG